MNYLLDTHTLLWYLYDDAREPEEIKDLIDEADYVCVSIVSFWEIAIKQTIHKLEFECDLSFLAQICAMKDIKIINIEINDLDILKTLPLIHTDPFDRLLVAQSKKRKFQMITADRNIPLYDVKTVYFKKNGL